MSGKTQPIKKLYKELEFESESRKKRRDTQDGITLNDEQLWVMEELLSSNCNAAILGEAGCGKSVFLRALASKMQSQNYEVEIVAPTGIVAVQNDGVTFHKFFGIGINKSYEKMIDAAKKFALGNIARCNHQYSTKKGFVILFDEISMISKPMLDNLDRLCREIRRKQNIPFGGIRVIFFGDYMQLPPIKEHDDPDTLFAFESVFWKNHVTNIYQLTQNYRQADHKFLKILREVRINEPTPETLAELAAMSNNTFPDGIEPVFLCALNTQVDKINKERLDQIHSEVHEYTAKDNGDEKSLEHLVVRKTIPLKVGAQVMLLKNMDFPEGYCYNGLLGIVIDFVYDDVDVEHPIVKFTNGVTATIDQVTFEVMHKDEVIATRTAIPLALGYALSIHKSQGQTLQYIQIDVKGMFEYGQLYVALSRAREAKNVRLINFNPKLIRCSEKAKNYSHNNKQFMRYDQFQK